MKILILSDSFPPASKGGADRIAFNLSEGFAESGHQVFIITTTQDKDKEKISLSGGEKEKNVFRIFVPEGDPCWSAYACLYNRQVASKAEKIVKEIKPEVVNVHNLQSFLSYHCLKAIRSRKRSVFLTAHDTMLFHYGKLVEFLDKGSKPPFDYRVGVLDQIKRFKKRYNPLRNLIIKHYLKKVDMILPVSYALEEALNQNGIKKTSVVHNGINPKEWQIEESIVNKFKENNNLFDKRAILFGGRLSAPKGGEKIIEAMEIINQQMPKAVLLVAGEKDIYAQKMVSLAEQKGVKIIMLGWISGEELKAAYWASDLVTVPSLYLDPFPTINLEAMACHRPVVGTCFGGTPEIIRDDKTGYIVNPFDKRALAEKIEGLLKNPLRARAFGEAGYRRIKKHFTLREQTKKYLDFFKEKNKQH